MYLNCRGHQIEWNFIVGDIQIEWHFLLEITSWSEFWLSRTHKLGGIAILEFRNIFFFVIFKVQNKYIYISSYYALQAGLIVNILKIGSKATSSGGGPLVISHKCRLICWLILAPRPSMHFLHKTFPCTTDETSHGAKFHSSSCLISWLPETDLCKTTWCSPRLYLNGLIFPFGGVALK